MEIKVEPVLINVEYSDEEGKHEEVFINGTIQEVYDRYYTKNLLGEISGFAITVITGFTVKDTNQ